MAIIKITKEMFEGCKIPESKRGITMTFESSNDENYEDDEYICWNGACVKKRISKGDN